MNWQFKHLLLFFIRSLENYIKIPRVSRLFSSGNAENTVMQALESLNDNQVNDFLSGKSPLNLSVRLGDHLMMIQVSFPLIQSKS